MSGFVLIAALLALGAGALLAVPLIRRRADGAPPARLAAALSVALLAAGAAALYPLWSTYDWNAEPAAGVTPENMVGRLARRLEREPEDLNGWLMLGRSYAQLGQYPLAVRAYRRADRVAGGRNADALSGLGEALILGEQSDLKGEAGRMFEKALELDPRSIRALFYGAVAAYERGELPLARQRFELLLTGDPPPEVRQLIERQLLAMEVQAQQRAAAPEQPGATASSVLRLRVSIDPKVAGGASAGAPLFVSVRLAGQAGPPLAAKRIEARFPQDVEISAADAMIPGRSFAAGQEVEITARVANGGSASARPGDPVGTLRHTVGSGGGTPLQLRIDRLTPP